MRSFCDHTWKFNSKKIPFEAMKRSKKFQTDSWKIGCQFTSLNTLKCEKVHIENIQLYTAYGILDEKFAQDENQISITKVTN